MKVLFIGDIHTHNYMFDDIERLDKEYIFDKIIFHGDYVDDWLAKNNESLITLDKVINLKKSNPNKYILLLGNHELSYLGFPCSGHRYDIENDISNKLKDNINYFDLYTITNIDNKEYVSTHGGITNSYIHGVITRVIPGLKNSEWKQGLDVMNKYKKDSLNLLTYVSALRGGYHEYSSMVWCDKREHEFFSSLEKYFIPNQIIGHTPVSTISYISSEDSMLYFIDTHSTYRDGRNIGDKSYLIYDEVFKVVK